MSDHARRPVVLYDGSCRFCRSAARLAASLDRREELAFLPLQDEQAARLLASVGEDERRSTWWLVEADGSAHSRGRAGLALLEQLSGWRRVARLLRPVGGALDPLYEAVAKRRHQIGRIVPDRPGPLRYP